MWRYIALNKFQVRHGSVEELVKQVRAYYYDENEPDEHNIPSASQLRDAARFCP